ncbi:unnamed protein product [Cyprideis torosa]|uniref:protein-tyrosine-phosphatase n=1 Tax=Cyprideis torosa TaxID=163714 RepID=A0A7R8W4T9_9CRUS|nr:unnamed protein product [Cyprideis torosa]CAG0879893.1 unnamed protein product [Cyprideis torosa]
MLDGNESDEYQGSSGNEEETAAVIRQNGSASGSSSKSSRIPDIEDQFKKIEKIGWQAAFHELRRSDVHRDLPTKEAKRSCHRDLNRYRDVSPYDHTRIVLKNCPKNKYGYINASHVSVPSANRKYILAQGPLPITIGHFWLMVWQSNSRAVVMLNRVIEKNQIKCSLYWPDGVNNSHKDEVVCEDVKIRVRLLKEEDQNYFVVRTFLLTNEEDKTTKEVFHFHYTTWPDFGVPESPAAFLAFLDSVRRSGALSPDVGPCVVHCSAGIGRSGTFCLVDSALVLLMEKEQPVNVKELLLEMRKQRMGLIQTYEQLRFSYLAIIQGMKDPAFQPPPTPERTVEKESPPEPPPRSASLSPPRETSSPQETPITPTTEAGASPGAESEREARRKRKQEMVASMQAKQRKAERWRKVRQVLNHPYVISAGVAVAGVTLLYAIRYFGAMTKRRRRNKGKGLIRTGGLLMATNRQLNSALSRRTRQGMNEVEEESSEGLAPPPCPPAPEECIDEEAEEDAPIPTDDQPKAPPLAPSNGDEGESEPPDPIMLEDEEEESSPSKGKSSAKQQGPSSFPLPPSPEESSTASASKKKGKKRKSDDTPTTSGSSQPPPCPGIVGAALHPPPDPSENGRSPLVNEAAFEEMANFADTALAALEATSCVHEQQQCELLDQLESFLFSPVTMSYTGHPRITEALKRLEVFRQSRFRCLRQTLQSACVCAPCLYTHALASGSKQTQTAPFSSTDNIDVYAEKIRFIQAARFHVSDLIAWRRDEGINWKKLFHFMNVSPDACRDFAPALDNYVELPSHPPIGETFAHSCMAVLHERISEIAVFTARRVSPAPPAPPRVERAQLPRNIRGRKRTGGGAAASMASAGPASFKIKGTIRVDRGTSTEDLPNSSAFSPPSLRSTPPAQEPKRKGVAVASSPSPSQTPPSPRKTKPPEQPTPSFTQASTSTNVNTTTKRSCPPPPSQVPVPPTSFPPRKGPAPQSAAAPSAKPTYAKAPWDRCGTWTVDEKTVKLAMGTGAKKSRRPHTHSHSNRAAKNGAGTSSSEVYNADRWSNYLADVADFDDAYQDIVFEVYDHIREMYCHLCEVKSRYRHLAVPWYGYFPASVDEAHLSILMLLVQLYHMNELIAVPPLLVSVVPHRERYQILRPYFEPTILEVLRKHQEEQEKHRLDLSQAEERAAQAARKTSKEVTFRSNVYEEYMENFWKISHDDKVLLVRLLKELIACNGSPDDCLDEGATPERKKMMWELRIKIRNLLYHHPVLFEATPEDELLAEVVVTDMLTKLNEICNEPGKPCPIDYSDPKKAIVQFQQLLWKRLDTLDGVLTTEAKDLVASTIKIPSFFNDENLRKFVLEDKALLEGGEGLSDLLGTLMEKPEAWKKWDGLLKAAIAEGGDAAIPELTRDMIKSSTATSGTANGPLASVSNKASDDLKRKGSKSEQPRRGSEGSTSLDRIHQETLRMLLQIPSGSKTDKALDSFVKEARTFADKRAAEVAAAIRETALAAAKMD